MRNLSYVFLDGNLTNDPEKKKTNSGKTCTTFTVAINHDDHEDVSFIDVETWEKTAENCAEYLKKGKKITLVGNLKQERWKAQDGTFRQRFKVISEKVRFDFMGYGNKEKKAA